MQRGEQATKNISLALVDGLDLADGTPVWVTDCCPNQLFTAKFVRDVILRNFVFGAP